MAIQFRDPEDDDLDWLIQSHDEIYRKEFSFNQEFGLAIAHKVRRLTTAENDLTRFWIALVNDERAGSVAVSELDSETVFINFLLIHEQYRGLGLSRRLIELTLEQARTCGYSTIKLETFDVLTVARSLYQRMGFELCAPVRDISRFGPMIKQEFYQLSLG